MKGDPVIGSQQKSDLYDMLALKFSPIYNYSHVVENSPVSTECREDLRRGGERFSHNHLSYFNLSLSTSLDKNNMTNSPKHQSFKSNISKIVKDKVTGNQLIIYNATKDNWKTVLLDNFRTMKNPCRHHTLGTKSGYYFIYDNQGIIHVLYDNMQICELTLPDERQDPSLFVYEKNMDQSILFVAGGHIAKCNGIMVLDTVAIFFLNFKELCKLLKHEPLFYIKMKYARMNPTIFKYKKDNEIMFLFLGGNDIDKVQFHQKDAHRKSMQNLFDSSNMFCETISFKRIRDNIFKSDFNQTGSLITTEDTLLMIFNGNCEENQLDKFRFYMDESAVLRFRLKKHCKKASFLVGAGKKKNEIWLIDKLDLVEHKIYIVRYSQSLKGNKNKVFCKPMITILDDQLFYFNNDEDNELKFKKLHLKGRVECRKGGCQIF